MLDIFSVILNVVYALALTMPDRAAILPITHSVLQAISVRLSLPFLNPYYHAQTHSCLSMSPLPFAQACKFP